MPLAMLNLIKNKSQFEIKSIFHETLLKTVAVQSERMSQLIIIINKTDLNSF